MLNLPSTLTTKKDYSSEASSALNKVTFYKFLDVL